jgi:hypothetical protein
MQQVLEIPGLLEMVLANLSYQELEDARLVSKFWTRMIDSSIALSLSLSLSLSNASCHQQPERTV